MSYYNLPKFALGIDWETSGYSVPDYASQHQGISYGAIVFELKTLEPVVEIYQELQFDSTRYKWDAKAERIHGLTQEHLKKNGTTQEESATLLCNTVLEYMGTEPVLIMGHRVHFDKAFTDQLTNTIGIKLDFHPTTIDTASLSTALMEMSRSEDVFQTLGLPPRAKHNALEDIRYTLASVQRIKELFLKGVMSEL